MLASKKVIFKKTIRNKIDFEDLITPKAAK